jgi:prepilin-type N-terminal cleavage/methylation domain-containing protein
MEGKKNRAFTLIELLVVIAIIGILASIVMVALNDSRTKTRDAERLSDMKQIQIALELYYDTYGSYPNNTDNDNGGWDAGCYGSGDTFIQPLVDNDFLPQTVCDPTNTLNTGGYRYYKYPAGTSGCNTSYGAFYVLGVIDMETSERPYPTSPGFRCPSQNWQSGMDWVTGRFESK